MSFGQLRFFFFNTISFGNGNCGQYSAMHYTHFFHPESHIQNLVHILQREQAPANVLSNKNVILLGFLM